jgi:hypothetical protein
MYCSSCGAFVAQDLSYCKNCGAKLRGTKVEGSTNSEDTFPDSLVWAIVTIFVVGLGATIGLMAVMKMVLGFNQGLIIAFTLMSFLLMLTVEGVFIWMLLDRVFGPRAAGKIARFEGQAMNQLGVAQSPSLAEPAPAATEHTTQTFEPIHREQKSK